MSKLLASDVIDVDDKFISKVKEQLKADLIAETKEEKLYTVKEIAKKIGKNSATIRIHINNYEKELFDARCLKAKKLGKEWVVTQESLDEYLLNN